MVPSLGASFENLLQWLTAGTLVAILGILAKTYVENRRLKLEEAKQQGDHTLKIKIDDRDGLTSLVGMLRDEVARIRTEHENCQKNLAAMSKKVDAMQRQFLYYQIHVVQRLPDGERSPEIDRMLESLERQVAQYTAPGSADDIAEVESEEIDPDSPAAP